MIKSSFKYGTDTIPMYLGYKLAHTKLLDLGIDIFSVLSTGEAVQTILMNDTIMLRVWYFYLTEHYGEIDFLEALEVLDESPSGLKPFKEAFWKMVVGFMPPETREALEKIPKELQKRLKNVPVESFIPSSSELSDSQE